MIEVLEWIFASGWRFLGVIVLINVIGAAVKGIITIRDKGPFE